MKTISLLKKRKRKENKWGEKQTCRHVSDRKRETKPAKMYKKVCAGECARLVCEHAHTLPRAVRRGAERAHTSTQSGAWACEIPALQGLGRPQCARVRARRQGVGREAECGNEGVCVCVWMFERERETVWPVPGAADVGGCA